MTWQEVASLPGHEGGTHVVRFNKNGNYCVSGGGDRKVTLWNPATGKQIKSYAGHGREVLDLALCKDNRMIVSDFNRDVSDSILRPHAEVTSRYFYGMY